MDGGDRAGYRQIAHNGDCMVITSTMSSTTCPWAEGWYGFMVISTKAAIAKITDAGMTGSSLFTSGTSWPTASWVGGNKITYLRISTKSTGHKVLAYRKLLI